MTVACPRCGTTNNLDPARPGQNAKCGRCGAPLSPPAAPAAAAPASRTFARLEDLLSAEVPLHTIEAIALGNSDVRRAESSGGLIITFVIGAVFFVLGLTGVLGRKFDEILEFAPGISLGLMALVAIVFFVRNKVAGLKKIADAVVLTGSDLVVFEGTTRQPSGAYAYVACHRFPRRAVREAGATGALPESLDTRGIVSAIVTPLVRAGVGRLYDTIQFAVGGREVKIHGRISSKAGWESLGRTLNIVSLHACLDRCLHGPTPPAAPARSPDPPAAPRGEARPPASAPATAPASPQVRLRFRHVWSETRPGDRIVVVGSLPQLGMWDPHRGLTLTTSPRDFPSWSGEVAVARGTSFEYKFVRVSANRDVTWEFGANRKLVADRDGAHG